MKNYVKEGQKLPLFGVGPYIVYGMAAVCILAVVLFSYVWKAGILEGAWVWVFRIAGVLLLALGLFIWSAGALRSGMDENIAENRLKTDGIYAWVRNPMYTGWWMALTGIMLFWHNAWTLLTVPANWAIMTVSLRHTEEKWLAALYGEEYEAYRARVSRCIPWFPRTKGRKMRKDPPA